VLPDIGDLEAFDTLDNTQLLPLRTFVVGRASVLHEDGSMDRATILQLDDVDGGRKWFAMSEEMAVGLAYTIFELTMMEGEADASAE